MRLNRIRLLGKGLIFQYANEALQDGGFSSTTLKSALDSLIKKDICDKKTSEFI